MLRSLFRRAFPEKSPTDFPAGYIPNRFIMKSIDRGPVLVVGDYTGRDFPPLRRLYPDTRLLDIVDNGIASSEELVLQSIESRTLFSDESFRFVVLAEVIEHLFDDLAALLEIRRILTPDGALVMTLPFYHDKPACHFRIHSPRSVVRLLEHAGFRVTHFSYRGLATSLLAAPTVGALALFLYPFLSTRSLECINSLSYTLHRLVSQIEFLNRPFRGFGGMIIVVKTDSVPDALEEQIRVFRGSLGGN